MYVLCKYIKKNQNFCNDYFFLFFSFSFASEQSLYIAWACFRCLQSKKKVTYSDTSVFFRLPHIVQTKMNDFIYLFPFLSQSIFFERKFNVLAVPKICKVDLFVRISETRTTITCVTCY